MTDKPKPIVIAREYLVRLNSIRDWVWDDPMHVFLSDLIHTALHYMDEADRLRAILKSIEARECECYLEGDSTCCHWEDKKIAEDALHAEAKGDK